MAGDEVGAARRAARLGVVVGEQHALGGDLVEVRRAARHHAAVVGADVPDADVVAHDDDDVGPLRRCCACALRRIEQRDRHQRGRADQRGAGSRLANVPNGLADGRHECSTVDPFLLQSNNIVFACNHERPKLEDVHDRPASRCLFVAPDVAASSVAEAGAQLTGGRP